MTSDLLTKRHHFGFQLRVDAGVTPPPAVKDLDKTVSLLLARGAQLLWTAWMKRPEAVSYGDLDTFVAVSDPTSAHHRFSGSTLAADTEMASGYSSAFSKLVGLSFMEEYSGASWFTPLRSLWNGTLQTSGGLLTIKKKHPQADGPDALAAPFDPNKSELGGPFYGVEFKGRSSRVELSHSKFDEWIAQSENIDVRLDSTKVNLKSWVVAFNYGFEHPKGSRETSTLLVADPSSAPDAQPLAPTRTNGAALIRSHLARQCRWLGASAIAPGVRHGISSLDLAAPPPPLFRVKHPRLQNRRYIGAWYQSLPDGRLIQPLGLLQLQLVHPNARPRHSAQGTEPTAVVAIAALFGSPMFFIGQDATMLRKCMTTPVGSPLEGEPFATPLSVSALSVGEAGGSRYLSLLNNGNIVADPDFVEPADDTQAFWTTK